MIVNEEKEKVETVTVRELINKLIEQNPNDEIYITDELGVELHKVSINVREVKYLGALFG